jgi:ubiquinone/menaquinone biosynthesis C-methylase UbiE
MADKPLLLETAGGIIPLSYVMDGDNVYLMESGAGSRWPSFALRQRHVNFEINGARKSGVVSLVVDEDERRVVIESFRLKYGSDYVSKLFRDSSRIICIDPQLTFHPSDNSYYEWLEEEFDSVADSYDTHIFGNRINLLLRKRSLETLRHYLKKGDNILEIGCGTGAETIELLRDGYEICSVDISSRMLENLRRKAQSEGFSDRLTLRKMRASELSRLRKEMGSDSFDLCYSTYGALNCEPELKNLPSEISMLLKRDGYFVAGVYNKFCISEIICYSISMKFSRLFWRFGNPIPEGRSRFCIDVYSFSFSEFSRLFEQYFETLEVRGAPVLLPPSNFKRAISLLERRFDKLENIDRALSNVWPLNLLGDHFIVVMVNRKQR